MANSDYTDKRIGFGFCPMGFLAAGITHLQTTVSITGYTSPIPNGIVVGAAAMIDDEIVVVNAVSGNILTLGRGCGDTIPAAHDTGAAIWFFDGSIARDSTEYAGGETIAVKLLPRLATGAAVPIPSSPATTIPFSFRFARPYAPGQMLVNGAPWFSTTPLLNESTSSMVLSWVHRDRVAQQDALVDHNAASVGPEAGTTYIARVYNDSDTLVHTSAAISGTTFTYSRAQAISHFAAGIGTHDGYMTVHAKRASFESWQAYRINFQFVGVATLDRFYDDIALMLHFNGADGSTAIDDSSPRPKSAAPIGGATIATDFSVFGGAALKLVGGGSRVHINNDDDLDLSSGDFTIEFRVRLDSTSISQIIINKGTGTGYFPFQCYWDQSTSKFVFRGFESGSTPSLAYTIAESGTSTSGVVYAIALERFGNTFYLKKDGTIVGSATFAGSLYSSSAQMSIGAYDNGSSPMTGRIDELRITKRLSRYGATGYTVPPSQFVDVGSIGFDASINTDVYAYSGDATIYRAVAYPAGGNASVTTNRTHVSGKRYFSVLLGSVSYESGFLAGIAAIDWVPANYVGSSSGSRSCHFNRDTGLGVWADGAFTALSGDPRAVTGDVAMVAIDFDAGKIWYGRNGVWYAGGNPTAGSSPTQTFTPGGRYVAAATEGYAGTRTFHLESGSPHAPPSGFLYWDALTP